MAKNVVDVVTGFMDKYGNEAVAVANALDAIMAGLALMPAERAKVKETISVLKDAAANITKAKAPAKITINKKDIEAAVAAVLPALLNDVVTKAVTDALAAESAANATGEPAKDAK